MMLQSKQTHIQFFALTIFLLYWNQIPVTAKPLDQEIAFDYREGSEKGPEHWGELKREWAACKDGRSQSPISLDESRATKVIQSSRDLIVSYKPSDAILKNEGYYIALEWEGDAGSIQIDGSDYFLKRCHWHTPSEHTINGVRYDLELHMVHQSADQNNIAVVSFLYEINQDISSVISTKEKKLGVIDPGEIKWASSRFYRYMGSLTTPPCTEGVIWTVNEKVDIVSREQLDLLKEAVYDYAVANARPLQRDEGRDIKLYGPSSLLSYLNAELPHRRRLNSAAIPRE
ncbi:alpha carbonic anhydrase 4-like [Pyrus x bretschneideri]|uniref:alpha carbonic anhydrase 4-like n=1 Tax=Pyrus x bretschneideri TaxID=225117 RepID=UPI00202E0CF9|nr:alpha carbonic anhydrase 4-like [Pyrus x bretschneideri]